jgi:AcrR family transcriptional regulator
LPESVQKWVEAGYELLAQEGPEGVQVEKLARKLGLNKSGFYHHFGDREIFFSKLIEHHYKVNDQFRYEIESARSFDPDFLNLVIKFRTAVFVQSQFRRNNDVKLYQETFFKIKKKNEKVIQPLWSDYLKIYDSPDLSIELWDIFRDVFFMRINYNMDLGQIRSIVHEFSRIVEVLILHVKNSDSLRKS